MEDGARKTGIEDVGNENPRQEQKQACDQILHRRVESNAQLVVDCLFLKVKYMGGIGET
jgi:hypothetical protein